MPDLIRTPRILRAATSVALADLRTIYTPFTWTVGWLGRIVVQVIFFAVIGLLLEDQEAVRYLFIGQAVMACVVEVFMSIASTTWERNAGTLPLLIAAPGPLWPVFVGRSVQWLPSGTATATVALLLIGPFFGVDWTVGAAIAAVGCVLVTGAGMYAVALTLAAVVLRGPRWRNVVSNVAHTSVMLICGVTVPTLMWPGWVRAIGEVLPLTHGLQAVRALEAGTAGAAGQLGWAALSGAGWFVIAGIAFTVFGGAGRRDGSIDFSE